MTLTPERASDLHDLNLEFLQLIRKSESGEIYGLTPETFKEIQSAEPHLIEKVAKTDILLFSCVVCGAGHIDGLPQGLPSLVERMQIVVRDFAREDIGLAVGYTNTTKAECKEILQRSTSQIRADSQKKALKIVPIGGTHSFRMLGAFAGPAERMQYVTLSAND